MLLTFRKKKHENLGGTNLTKKKTRKFNKNKINRVEIYKINHNL